MAWYVLKKANNMRLPKINDKIKKITCCLPATIYEKGFTACTEGSGILYLLGSYTREFNNFHFNNDKDDKIWIKREQL